LENVFNLLGKIARLDIPKTSRSYFLSNSNRTHACANKSANSEAKYVVKPSSSYETSDEPKYIAIHIAK